MVITFCLDSNNISELGFKCIVPSGFKASTINSSNFSLRFAEAINKPMLLICNNKL